jgi:hypothetical protein
MSGKVACLFGILLSAYACGNADEPATPAEGFCKGFCKAATSCGAPSTCEADCIAQRPQLSMLSLDGAQRLGACISGFDCATLEQDALWQPAFQSCWDEVRSYVKPTLELRSFCESYAEAWFQCGSWFSTADCENDYGMWSEDTLDRLSGCDSSACDALDACVKGVLGS